MQWVIPSTHGVFPRCAAAMVVFLATHIQAVADDPVKKAAISEAEVNAAQQAWCDGLVKIERKLRDTDKSEFPQAWERYLKKVTTPLDGTPISEWPALNRARLPGTAPPRPWRLRWPPAMRWCCCVRATLPSTPAPPMPYSPWLNAIRPVRWR